MTATECLQSTEMDQLLTGDIGAAQQEIWEDHLSSCEACQTNMQAIIGDRIWWDEAERSLSIQSPLDGFDVSPASERSDDECHNYDELLSMLGPTDSPNMLGRIGNYEVVGILGRGGMGVVYKALDTALNRYVAIKMLLPHLAASGPARKRFEREGQAAAAVVDDHVLPIYAVSKWQGIPYLVMHYSSGATLQRRLDVDGPLALKEVLRIGIQASRGLAAAHAQGLVHRDVKPSNILLDGGVERVMLTDFGLARAADDASITRTGTIAGTPQYMSPEQVRGESVDGRSDLFGLGCVLYALCTGHPPFRAGTSYAILRRITDDTPRSIQEINPDIPSWMDRFVTKLLAKSPDSRFASATIVADHLQGCLAHVQQPTEAPFPDSIVDLSDNTATSRATSAKAAAVIACVFLMAGAAWWLGKSAKQDRSNSAIEQRPNGEPSTTATVIIHPPDADEANTKWIDDWQPSIQELKNQSLRLEIATQSDFAIGPGNIHPNHEGTR